MFSEPVRRKAMETARDSNETKISGKIILVQETGKEVQAGFLIYLPVYRNGASHKTVQERRANIIGWVYSPFRMNDFMAGLLGERSADLDVEIYDGNKISNKTKMYDSKTHTLKFNHLLTLNKEINFDGHKWTVIVKSTPELESRIGFNISIIILIAGLVLSLLLTIITWQIAKKRMLTKIANTKRQQAEEELKRREKSYRTLTENLPASVYRLYLREKGKMEFFNDIIEEITGYTKDELRKGETCSIDPFILSEDKPLVMEIVSNAIKNKSAFEVEYRFKRKDGHLSYFYEKGIPIIGEDGNPVYIEGVIFDITDRKLAENKLQESETRFKQISEGTEEWIWEVDANGVFTYVNSLVKELLGYDPEELIGVKHFYEYFEPEHKEEMKRGAFEVFARKESFRNFINCNIHKDGRRIILSTSGFPIFDSENNLIGYRGIDVDITARQKAEDELKISEMKFRNIVEGTKAILFSTNRRGIFTYLNEAACKKLEMENQELLGKFYLKFVHPESRSKVHSVFSEQIKNPAPNKSVDVQIITKSGKDGWLNVLVNPIYEEGKVVGLSSVALDITDRKRVEKEIKEKNEQLVKLNAEKDKFFSIISHDLRSPFQGLIGLTDMVASDSEEFSREDFMGYCKSIHDSSFSLFKLIENLLAWAQMQSGSMNFTPRKIEVHKIVSKCIETIKDRSANKGISIINEVSELHKVYADEDMLDSVMRNLISNAVKFTKRGGKVIIRAKKAANEMVEISVRDTGVGLSEKNIKRLFKVEEKVSSEGTEGEPSTGLGLLLCKEFIEKNGGKIWAESEEGKGSTFYITIPDSPLKTSE